jgi:xanthine/CO dehydrogenase XdhC/CoxF family maturation factor
MESDLGPLLPLWERERSAGRPVALAILTRTLGSTYQRPGALLLISSRGEYAGLISGGCLEGDLAEYARAVIESGRARAIDYDLRDPNDLIWGLGAGCEGAMHVLLVRVGPAEQWEPLSCLAQAYATHSPAAIGVIAESDDPQLPLGTVFGADSAPAALSDAARAALAAAPRAERPGWHTEPGRYALFLLPLALPPRLLLLGAGPDAVPLTRIACELHWKVTVADHRAAFASAERFPLAHRIVHTRPEALEEALRLAAFEAAVVMSHQLQADREYLRALARSPVPYVGLLGPPARRDRLLDELAADGEPLARRLHAPVGLNLGGRSPQAIAVSIVAEILAHRHRCLDQAHLRRPAAS